MTYNHTLDTKYVMITINNQISVIPIHIYIMDKFLVFCFDFYLVRALTFFEDFHLVAASKRQIQALSSDTETTEEKTHNIIELVLERPSLSKVMDNLEPNVSESGQYLFSYYILLICSQAFVM